MADGDSRTVITELVFTASGIDEATDQSTALLDLLNRIEAEAQAAGKSLSAIAGGSGGLSDLSSQASDATSSIQDLTSASTDASSALQSITGGDAAAGLQDLSGASQDTAGSLESLGSAGSDASTSLQGISGGDAAAGLADVGSAAQTLGSDLDTASTSASGLSSALSSGDFSSLGPDIDSAAQSLQTLSTDATTAETSLSGLSGGSGLADLASQAEEAGNSLATEGTEAEDAGNANREAGDGAEEYAGKQAGLGAAVGTATGFLTEQIGVSGEIADKAHEAFDAISEFASGEGEAGAGADAAAGAVLALGGAIAGISVEQFVSLTDSVHELNEVTGLSVPLIQGLGYAEETIGGSAGDADAALSRLARTIGQARDALENGGTVSKNFAQGVEALGLSVSDLVAMSPDQAFLAIDDAFSKLPDDADRATISFELAGRAGQSMIGVFDQGNSAIETGKQKVDEYGASVDGAWPKVNALHTSLADLQTMEQGLANTIGSDVVPALTNMAGVLVTEASDAGNLMHQLDLLASWGHTGGQDAASGAQGLGDSLRSAFNEGTTRSASLASDAIKDINASLENEIPPLRAAETEWQLLNLQQDRNAQIAKEGAATRAANPPHQATDTTHTYTDDQGNKTVIQDAQAGTAALQGESAAAGTFVNSLKGIVTASLEAGTAAATWTQITAPTPAQTAAEQLTTDIDNASAAYTSAKTAQDKLFNQPTAQQTSGADTLQGLNTQLAGYQQQLSSLTPGTQAYADTQTHITSLQKEAIPQQEALNKSVDASVAFIRTSATEMQNGTITTDEYNKRVNDTAAANPAAAASLNLVTQAVANTAAGQQAATQTTNDLEASQEGLNRGFITGAPLIAAAGDGATAAAGGWSALGQSVTDASAPLTNSGQQLGQLGTDATTAGGAVDSAGTVMGTSLDNTGTHLDTSRSNFLDWHTTSSKAAGDTASDTQTATSGIQGSLSDTGASLTTSGGDFQNWQQAGTSAVESLKSTVESELDSLQEDAYSQGNAIGTAIDDGITVGIANSSGEIQAAAAGAVNAAVSAAKAAGQISSPSQRTYDEVGTPLVQGATNAIADGAGPIAQAMAALVDSALSAGGGELVGIPQELAGSPFSASMHTGSDWNIGQHDAWNISQHSSLSDWQVHQHGGAAGAAGGTGLDAPGALNALAVAAEQATTALNGLTAAANAHGGGSGGSGGNADGLQDSSIGDWAINSFQQAQGELVSTGRQIDTAISQGMTDSGGSLESAVTDLMTGSVIDPLMVGMQPVGGELVGILGDSLSQAGPQFTDIAGHLGMDAGTSIAQHIDDATAGIDFTIAQHIQNGSSQVTAAAAQLGTQAGQTAAQAAQAATAAPSGSGSGSGGGAGGGGGGLGLLQPGIGLGTSTDNTATTAGQHLSQGEVADWSLIQWAASLRQPINLTVRIGDATLYDVVDRAVGGAMATRVQGNGS